MVNELSDWKQTPGSVKVYWHKLGCEQSGTHRSYNQRESGLLGKGVWGLDMWVNNKAAKEDICNIMKVKGTP